MRSLAKIAWDRARVLTSAQKQRKRERSKWTMRRLRGGLKPKRVSLWKIWGPYMAEYRAEIKVLRRDLWVRHPGVGRHFSLKAYYADHEANKERCKINAKRQYERIRADDELYAARLAKRNQFRKAHPDREAAYKRKWLDSESGKQWMREFRRKLRQDPIYKINNNLRKRLQRISKIKFPAGDMAERKKQIESTWKRGMTWENYGTKWHVDHIVPLSHWDMSNPDHIFRAQHPSNLQALWWKDNLKKGNKFNGNLLLPLLPSTKESVFIST